MSLLNRKADPSRNLKKFMNLPLQFEFSEDEQAQFRKIEDEIKSFEEREEKNWFVIYDQSVKFAEKLLETITQKEAELQLLKLQEEQTLQNQKREMQDLQRDLDRKIQNISTVFSSIQRDWKERFKRQATQLMEDISLNIRRDLTFDETPTENGLEIQVSSYWWNTYQRHIMECCDLWNQNVCNRLATQVKQDINPLLTELCSMLNTKVYPEEPNSSNPKNRGNLSQEKLPCENLQVPSTAAALFKYLRTHIMSVGILASILVPLLATMPSLLAFLGMDPRGSTSSFRGILILAVLPVLLFFGWKAINNQKVEDYEQAKLKETEQAYRHIKGITQTALNNHQGELERWMNSLITNWTASIHSWKTDVLMQELRNQQNETENVLNQKKLQTRNQAEAANQFKSFRRTLEGRILVELKTDLKRHS